MRNLKVSFAYAGNIYSIVLVDSTGVLVERKVATFDSYTMEQLPIYKNIFICKLALMMAKVFVDKNSDYESMVVETSGIGLINRINKGWSDDCKSEFLEMLKVLDSIPVMYSFRTNAHLLAKKYTKKKYLPSETMFSLDDFDDVQDEG